MADQKISALTADTNPTIDDLVATVTDPAGTPASRKVTLGALGALNPYCFRANDSAGTTLTDATIVQVNFGTENYDYNGNFATNAYTAPFAGVYHFDFCFTINGAIASQLDGLALIYVNGASVMTGSRYLTVTTDGAYTCSGDLLLAASDAVTCRAYQDSGGNEATKTGSSNTWFSGHLIHRTA